MINGASPTLRNNRIHGGTGFTPFGVYNFSASPTVQGNTINGGIGIDKSYGIYNVYSLALIQGKCHLCWKRNDQLLRHFQRRHRWLVAHHTQQYHPWRRSAA